MKKIISNITLAAVLLTTAMAASAQPFKMSAAERTIAYNDFIEVTITSTSDDLVIQKVTMNRNHCRIGVDAFNGKKPYPVKLNYGEVATFKFFECPSMLDAQVYTNQGNSSWTFGN